MVAMCSYVLIVIKMKEIKMFYTLYLIVSELTTCLMC